MTTKSTDKMTRAQMVARMDEQDRAHTRARMALQAVEMVNDCVLSEVGITPDEAAITTTTLTKVALLALRGDP